MSRKGKRSSLKLRKVEAGRMPSEPRLKVISSDLSFNEPSLSNTSVLQYLPAQPFHPEPTSLIAILLTNTYNT